MNGSAADIVVVPRASTPATLSPSAPSSGLPPELLASASRRVAFAALLYAGVYALNWVFNAAAVALDLGEFGSSEREPWDTIALTFVTLSLAMYGLARHAKLAPDLVLQIALVYEVVGAIGIDIGLLWWPRDMPLAMSMMLSWSTIWIVFFPMLVPASPGRTLVAALIAASVKPLFVLILMARGVPAPPPGALLLMAFPGYVCAGMAYVGSRILYGLGKEVGRARRMGSYQLIELLGAGGMGEVWRAEHRLLAMPAAIKLIRPDALVHTDHDGRRQLVKRFEREARATAALTSPHTVQIYDFGTTEDGAFYYVMELLHGLDADALVKRFGPLPPERVVYVLRQVCDSLAEAHRRSCVHRDVKPANVFLCRRGLIHDFVKVLDFGLVKAAGPARAETALTRQHAAAGTPAFMAPEAALGEADVDTRADIYSVGCLGYWLLTGTLVFEGNEMQVAVAHVGAEPRAPSERTSRPVPAELERIVLDCLAKDRERRPQTAGELGRRLRSLALAEPWNRDRAATWWREHLPEYAA